MSESDNCSYQGCDRQRFALGLCTGHYQQQHSGRELAPLRKVRSGLHKDETGRVCTGCDTYKPWNQYYGKRSRCKRCVIEQNSKNNRDRRTA